MNNFALYAIRLKQKVQLERVKLFSSVLIKQKVKPTLTRFLLIIHFYKPTWLFLCRRGKKKHQTAEVE